MYQDKGLLYFEDDDQCNSCEYVAKGIACPLVKALQENVVVLSDESILVFGCGFYKKFERKLKAI
jgi:hypothetical protein